MTFNKINNEESHQISQQILRKYEEFLKEMSRLFPKVDQDLLLDMIYYQTKYHDWEGSVLLRIVYPQGTDLNPKRDWIYNKYQKVAPTEEDRTIKFKAIRMYLQELEQLLNEDKEIEFITGSATLTPSDAYSA